MSEEFLNQENDEAQASQEVDNAVRWYVVHTYSGYENKVKANIEKIIENRGMQNQILEVSVPVQEVEEIKNGQKKRVQRKVFPGYVLLKMVMNDETWYVVRNIRGVTSFVGPGSKPVPLTEEEAKSMGIEQYIQNFDCEVGDTVRVTDGPFADSVGVIKEVNPSKQSVVAVLPIFGRETPVELNYNQLEKL